MNEITVTITGNVASEPQGRTTSTGNPMTTFRLASTVRRNQEGQWVDLHTSFVNVVCFGRLARNVQGSLEQGFPVVLRGRLQVRQWSTDERSGTAVDVVADTIGHDLTFMHGKLTKGMWRPTGTDQLADPVVDSALSELAEDGAPDSTPDSALESTDESTDERADRRELVGSAAGSEPPF